MSIDDYDFRERGTRLHQLPPPDRRFPGGLWIGPFLLASLISWALIFGCVGYVGRAGGWW